MAARIRPTSRVIAKARTYERGFPWFLIDIVTQFQEQGVDYITALLTGYEEPPQGVELPAGKYYNKYFPGHVISHAAADQRRADRVSEERGRPSAGPETVAQYAKDVSAFLMWAAEPHLEQRKEIGFKIMIFLLVFAGLLYFTKKRIWCVEGHAERSARRRKPDASGQLRRKGVPRSGLHAYVHQGASHDGRQFSASSAVPASTTCPA